MPLLRRQPFVRQKLPRDFDPDEELFYCKLTKEVFRDYDEFFQRVILCNSLEWTCEMTGRPGLTYAEAKESETKAKRWLKTFPDMLKIPVLFLASLTHRGRLIDMCDDVYGFSRERFFVGEDVDGIIKGQRVECEIVRVIPLQSSCNGFCDDESGSEVEFQNTMNNGNEKKRYYGPSPSQYQYDVKMIDETKYILSHECILRKKGAYTRDKLKLFLKQYCEPRDGIWSLKQAVEKKCNLTAVSFFDLFAGPVPKFVKSVNKKLANQMARAKLAKSKTIGNGVHPAAKGKSDLKKDIREKSKQITIDDIKEIRREIESRQKIREEEKQRKREEKEKERERKREERRLKAEILREWQRPRDDLECDDLKDIPSLAIIDCSFPNELFGDAVMVLEFLNTFGELLKLEESFPQGFTFDDMEKVLIETDVRGHFSELLQFFLQCIFALQEGEKTPLENPILEAPGIPESYDDDSDLATIEAMKAASAAAAWPQRFQGLPLADIALDSFTISEVLRLHLLSFGSQFAHFKLDPQLKGTYTMFDDPALQLRLSDPSLLKALSTKCIFDFSPAERLKVLHILMNQLLNFTTVRYYIEDNMDKVRNARIDLKQMQWAEQRKEREEAALKLQKEIDKGEQTEDTKNETKEVEDAKAKKRKNAEEIAQQKRDNLKKQELAEIIERLHGFGGVQPLGRDRNYRRFWTFESIAGLFVEHDDEFVGRCLTNPTPQRLEVATQEDDDDSSKEEKVSDKENEVENKEDSIVAKNHKLLSDNHPTDKIKTETSDIKLTEKADNIADDGDCLKNVKDEAQENLTNDFKRINLLGKCTADVETCTVHNLELQGDSARWCFVSSLEEFEKLLSSLNQRGFRESGLKDALYHQRKRIVDSISQCPLQKLNSGCAGDDLQMDARKIAYLNGLPVLGCEIPPLELMETILREMILDIEERIDAGVLGSIKVNCRDAWRKAILERTYNMQCEGVIIGRPTNHVKKEEEADSERRTPMELTQESLLATTVDQTVKDLASALLQIAQGVERKFMKPPLGEEEEIKKKPRSRVSDAKKGKKDNGKEMPRDVDNEKENADKENKTKLQKTVYERWEESLMASTSLSQIFVHLSTLERSIVWSKSILNARCRICHRRGDAERMLLCDECNRGHHMYCLRPQLKEIPEGDWFCLDCRPKERRKPKPPVPKRSSRKIVYTDDEEEEEELEKKQKEKSEEMEVDENVLECDEDSNFTFIKDVEDDGELKEGNDLEVKNEDLCDFCGREGTLICCDNCPLAYHLECVDPPLHHIPKGRWECQNCVQKLSSSGGVKNRLRNHGKRPATDTGDSSPAKRTRSRDNPIVEEDEIWMSGRKKHGPPVRRGASRDAPVDYKFCDQLLAELSRQESSWPFLRPVGKKQFPIYYEVIKRPIDLATMRFKLNNMEYRSTKHFLMDVLLLIQNCIMYNPLESNESVAAGELLNYLELYTASLGFEGLGELLDHTSGPSFQNSPVINSSRRSETKSDGKLDG